MRYKDIIIYLKTLVRIYFVYSKKDTMKRKLGMFTFFLRKDIKFQKPFSQLNFYTVLWTVSKYNCQV